MKEAARARNGLFRGAGGWGGQAWWNACFAVLPLAVITAFFTLPYLAALSPALNADTVIAAPARLWRVCVWTIVQAGLSAALAVIIGLPGAYIASAPEFKGKKLFNAISSIPFALPPILMALGFVLFWGNTGAVNRILGTFAGAGTDTPFLRILYHPQALIFCHAVYNFPLVIRFAGGAFARARQEYAPVAYALGAPPLVMMRTVALPLAAPAILAAALLVFLYSFTSFSIVLLIGGYHSTTLAVEIYRFARINLDFPAAALLSLVETVIAALVFAAYLYFERKSRVERTPDAILRYTHVQAKTTILPSAAAWGIALTALAPVLAVICDSFVINTASRSARPILSIAHYTGSGSRLVSAFCHSALLAVLAATIASVLAFLAAEAALDRGNRRNLAGTLTRWAVLMPAASSGITLGFGILLLYGREGARSVWTAALAQAALALPFAFNAVYTALKAIPRRLFDAAAVYGANPLRRLWTVDLPLCAGGLRAAWAFAACISFGELNTILMLGIDHWETLPVYIYRAAGAYRFGAASAAGTILIVCCFMIFWAAHEKTN